MPGNLYLGYRKLPFGSDDLVTPGIVGIITRTFMTVAWIVCLAFGVNSTPTVECSYALAPIDTAFLSISLCFGVIHTILYLLMTKFSLQGTLLHWKIRHKKCSKLIKTLAVTYFIELGLSCFGTYVVSQNGCATSSTLWIVELTALVLLWFDLISAIAFTYFLLRYFTPSKPKHYHVAWYKDQLFGIGWVFSLLTCGILGNIQSPEGFGDNAWMQFAEIVHSFFHDMMQDLLATDVLAALLLLRAEQKRHQQEKVDEFTERVLSSGGEWGASSPGSPGSVPFSPKSVLSSTTNSSDKKKIQSFLWGNESSQRINLKYQAVGSATPISSRTDWISNVLANEGRVASPMKRTEAFLVLEEFADLTIYQEAMYGWKLMAYRAPIKFLFLNCLKFVPQALQRKPIEGYVFSQVTGLGNQHILYSSFTSFLGEKIPYTICLDHERKAIVVSLRGSFTFQDLVTDLMASPVDLQMAGRQWGFDGAGHYAHGGMLQVAERIRLDIEKQQLLHELLKVHDYSEAFPDDKPVQVENMYDSRAFISRKQVREAQVSNYKLLVVGHSLGAGVGSILTLLLRNKFPFVHCYAYEPPGCIFSKELAEASNSWTNSIVCGVDIVPRLSWHNAKRLRGQLLEMLRRSKTSKGKILSSIFKKIPASELLYDVDSVPNEPIREDLERKIRSLAVENDTPLDRIRMYLPGKVLFLAKGATIRDRCCFRDRTYSPMWLDNREELQDIQVSQYLLWNHFANWNGDIIKKSLREALHAEGRVSFKGAVLLDALNPKLEV